MSKNAQIPAADVLADSPPRYCLYTRVSSDEQRDKNLSIPAQQREMLSYVARLGGLVVAEFSDPGFSATTDDRPGFQDMMAAARRPDPDGSAPFDIILVHYSDRFMRDEFLDLLYARELKSLGIARASVTESWYGSEDENDKLMENMARGQNAWFSRRQSRRIKDGQKQAAQNGRQGGVVPYGYDYVNKDVQGSGWKVCDEEAVWVRRMFSRVLEGASYSDVCRELNAAGIPPYSARARGRRGEARADAYWYAAVVRAILRNAVYTGHIQHQGQRLPGAHPALIDAETFARVQRILSTRAPRRADQSVRGLFVGGLLRCPLCGGPMMHKAKRASASVRASSNAPSDHVFYSHYHCQAAVQRARAATFGVSRPACAGFQISQKKTLALLTDYLSARARLRAGGPGRESAVEFSPALFSPALPALPTATPTRDREAERARLCAELAKLQRMRTGFQEVAAAGAMRLDELIAHQARLDERRAALEAMLSALDELPPPPASPTPRQARDLLSILTGDIPIVQQRDALRQRFAYLLPWPARDGISVALKSEP